MEAAMGLNHKQIGEVADRIGLSLRTIRYYEEVGLVAPSARSQGGFRLYSEADIARLQLIKRMKPLDFSLEEMRDLLDALDGLEQVAIERQTREDLVDRLAMFRLAAEERCASLRSQLESAEEFAGSLRREINRQRRAVSQAR
jgi:DNA-binding transcriptional MerR regulator